jgi:hypothetical protein
VEAPAKPASTALLDQVSADRGDSRPDCSDFDDSVQVLARIDDPTPFAPAHTPAQ